MSRSYLKQNKIKQLFIRQYRDIILYNVYIRITKYFPENGHGVHDRYAYMSYE